MSVANEITRIQNAKASLKASINAKTDSEHQITNEKIDDYSNFVDSIQTGGGTSYPPDWSQIGYSSTPQNIINDFNYSKDIYDNWENVSDLSNKFINDISLVYMPLVDTSNATNMNNMFRYCSKIFYIPLLNTSNCTNMNSMFYSCSNLTIIPLLNTSNCTNMNSMFYYCTNLTTVPLLDTSKVTNMGYMFTACNNINDTSLDNILKMCINATSYTGQKKLSALGFTSTKYPSSKIQALPSYQNFIDAEWTIGY